MGKLKKSTPKMGKAGGRGITLPVFASIGSAMQSVKNKIDAKNASNTLSLREPVPEGMYRSGKGGLKYKSDADKKRIEGVQKDKLTETIKYAKSVGGHSIPLMGKKRVDKMLRKISTPGMGITNKKYKFPANGKPSTPAMGYYGAIGGAYVGKKIGSWIGSAGKLIGKKHEQYGRKAGEYIGGSLGAALGGVYVPV